MRLVCGLSRLIAGFSPPARRGAAVVSVALALGLTAASPAAASLWTMPASVSEEGQSAHEPRVAVDAAGDAIAVWSRSGGTNDVVQAAVKPAGEPWGEPATLSEAGQDASEPQVAVDAAGDATVVWRRFGGSNYVVQTAVKPAREGWGKPATLSEAGQEASEPQVALDAADDAIAVWVRSNGSTDVVQGAAKPAGEPWGEPATLSEAGQDAHMPQVAVNAAGEATAVWAGSNGGNDVVQAAIRPAGESWAQPATVSGAGQEASQPQVAVDAAGDATVVWTRYTGLSSGGNSNYVVQATNKPAGEAWEEPTTVSEEGQEEGLEPRVAVDAAGEATAAWTRFIYGCCRLVQTAAKPAGKPWGEPTNLEVGGDARVAVNAAGEAAVVWTQYHGPGDLVQAAVKPVGKPWIKPATLSEDEASAPQVAVNAAGDATAVWTRYVGFGYGHYIVQAAQYAPSTAFTIETLQKLSAEPTYIRTQLNGEVAETVDYEIIVKNTGSTPLKFGALKDSACEGISPAGPTELEASTEETFTCTHKLTAFTKYGNEASIEGSEATGSEMSNNVTVALAPVYEAPAAAADSNSGSCVESRFALFACSNLRAALSYANADPGSTVKLERGVYRLGEAHGYLPGVHAFLEFTASMKIQGAGPQATTIEQTDGRDPVIVIPYSEGFSKIEIDDVKLTGGVAAGGDGGEFFGWEKGGGALRILESGTESSSVTLTDDYLTGNLAHAKTAMGGAVFNKRTLNIIDSTIAHNAARAEGAGDNTELGEAYGGGVFNTGHLLIADSTIADNTVEAGGIDSKAMGGGVDSGVENFTNNATAAIANTTITGNVASAGTTKNPPLVYGGGLAIDNGTVNHVTLYGNTASPVNAEESWGGNIFEPQNGGGTWINNSIVAGGIASDGPNCMFTSFGSYPEDNRQNLVEGPPGECGFTLEYGSLFDLSPQLVPLADNGGPTETLAPESRSPVIDASGDCEGSSGERGSGGWATATIPLDVDQRGMPRNGHCDIGAFQTEPPFATTPPQVSGTAETGKTLTCIPGTWAGEGALAYSYDWLRNGLSTGDETMSYTLEPSDARSQIACQVTASGTYGATEASSPSIEVRPSPPAVVPGAPGKPDEPSTTSPNPQQEPTGFEKQDEAPITTGVLGVKEALPDAKLANTSLTAGPGGMLSVEVSCPTETISCTGTITLKTLGAVSAVTARQSRKRKTVILTLAVGSFKVTGGHLTVIKLRLSSKAHALLSHTHWLRARATIVAHDPTGATHTTQTNLTIHIANVKRGKSRLSGNALQLPESAPVRRRRLYPCSLGSLGPQRSQRWSSAAPQRRDGAASSGVLLGSGDFDTTQPSRRPG